MYVCVCFVWCACVCELCSRYNQLTIRNDKPIRRLYVYVSRSYSPVFACLVARSLDAAGGAAVRGETFVMRTQTALCACVCVFMCVKGEYMCMRVWWCVWLMSGRESKYTARNTPVWPQVGRNYPIIHAI